MISPELPQVSIPASLSHETGQDGARIMIQTNFTSPNLQKSQLSMSTKASSETSLEENRASTPVEPVILPALNADIIVQGKIVLSEPVSSHQPEPVEGPQWAWVCFCDHLLNWVYRYFTAFLNRDDNLIKVGGPMVAVLLGFGIVAGIILVAGNTPAALILSGAAGIFLIICSIRFLLHGQ